MNKTEFIQKWFGDALTEMRKLQKAEFTADLDALIKTNQTAVNFAIQKFEQNYPTLVNLFEEWQAHSIAQNWDCVKVILNEYNVPDCPELGSVVGGETVYYAQRFAYTEKIVNLFIEYLFAKGFKRINKLYPVTLWSPYDTHLKGFCISAYTFV